MHESGGRPLDFANENSRDSFAEAITKKPGLGWVDCWEAALAANPKSPETRVERVEAGDRFRKLET